MNAHLLTVAKGSLIVSGGIFIENLLRVPLGIILARYLGPEQLGNYHLTISIILVLSSISLLGAGICLVRFIPIYKGNNDRQGLLGMLRLAFIIPAIFSVIGGICLYYFGPAIASSVFEDGSLPPLFRAAAFIVPVWVIGALGSAALRGNNSMYYFTLSAKIVLPVVRFLLIISLALAALLTAKAAIWSFGLAVFLSTGLAVHLFYKAISEEIKGISPRYDFSRLAGFALPGCAAQIVVFAGPNIKLLLLGFLGTSFDVGIFGPIYEISLLAALASTAVSLAATPQLSELLLRKDYGILNNFYKVISKWVVLVSLPLLLIIIIYPDVILLLFGEKYLVGSQPLQILGLAGATNIVLGLSQPIIIMSGRSGLNLLNIFVFYIIMFGLDCILIPLWGLLGAAIATLLATLAVSILRFVQVFLLIGIHPFNYEYMKPFLAGCIAAGFTLILRYHLISKTGWLSGVSGITVFICMYCLVVVWLRFSAEDREIINLAISKVTRSKV